MRRRSFIAPLAVLVASALAAGLAQPSFDVGLNDVATGTIPALESTHAYSLDVPPGTARVEIAVDGGGRDADLAVYLGTQELVRDTSSDPNPTFAIDAPAPGRYRIEVLNLLFHDLAYTLRVSGGPSGGPPAGTPHGPGDAKTPVAMGAIAVGDSVRGVIPAGRRFHDYQLDVSSGTAELSVRIDAGSLDADLAILRDGAALFVDIDPALTPAWHQADPAPGRYTVRVANLLGVDLPYHVQVSGARTPGPAPSTRGEVPVPDRDGWRVRFTSGETRGWTVRDGELVNPGAGGPDEGGYLYATTPGDGRSGYFLAPPELLGDWTGLAELALVIRHGPRYQGRLFGPYEYGADGDVVIENDGMRASYAFETPPSASWSTRLVPLRASSGWRLSGGARDLADVLANVTAFRIRAEYLVGDADAGLASVEARGPDAVAGPGPERGPYVRVAPAWASAGEELVVDFGGTPGNARDWIGIFAEGADDHDWLVWKYTEGARTGRLVFEVPATPGRYEARLFVDDGYERLARSGPFDVVR